MSDMTEAPSLDGGALPLGGKEAANTGHPLMDASFDENSNHYRFLADIPVRLSVEVGSVSMKLSEIMDLGEGSVVELGRQSTELLDIHVNGTLIAKGEVVTVDGRFGIRVAEVISKNVGSAKVERRA